ncbi:hypothetical protein ZIOFF_015995 [Zingiber officinale]|uniref:peptidylprolyl isomerase n=1 Tax=Zingiber officinale TaxID=94328 RepID=A0A8J5LWZ3_ZINOF|nr:hypothetical protein ZIOFF_015995 [Zingiber officinale]
MGVEKQLLKEGHGPKPTKGQSVTVHCTGFGSYAACLFLMKPFCSNLRSFELILSVGLTIAVGKDGDLSKKFWSTKDPGQQPFTFNIGLGSVIKGWDEGVMDMKVGEVALLQCTPDYAYGAGGFQAWGIRPNSPLVFEIEVLSVK